MTQVAVMDLDREEVIRERVRREKARRHLVDFCEYVSPWWHTARHHRVLGEYLEQVEIYIRTGGRTGIGRLLVEMPPRHGKSEMVSKHLPAWLLGRNPDKRVILASYGMDLAASNSRAARGLVEGERFRGVFGDLATTNDTNDTNGKSGVELSSDSRSVEAWDLASPHRGGVVAAGVGGGITGKGAHLFVLDDPFKNRDEAESEAYRERVWGWWTSSAYTRLEDGGAVIGMFTRWHVDDWGGRLLRNMALDMADGGGHADRWVVVWMPAIWEGQGLLNHEEHKGHEENQENKEDQETPPSVPPHLSTNGEGGFEEYQRRMLMEGVWVQREDELGRRGGEALWPEKYDEDDLRRIRANVGEYDWAALYQQMPYMRTGGMFKREWLSVVDSIPVNAKVIGRVRFWDKAGSSARGDYSVGVLLALTEEGGGLRGVYVEHVARGQLSSMERERLILETARADLGRSTRVELWHEQEPGSSGLDSARSTAMMLAQNGIRSQFEPVTGEKEVRAGPFSAACQAGRVRVVRGGWNREYVEELCAFPNGRHDDQVDASSGAFNKLGRMGGGSGGIHV